MYHNTPRALKRGILASAVALGFSPAWAVPSTLSAGDIAIVQYNADNPDNFAFVALTTLGSGTEIHFTDNGWTAGNTFRANEGTITWTAPSDISAGTVVTLANGNANISGSFPAQSSSGDQILAYQGASTAPTFLYALNAEGSAVWQADATSSNTSALPQGVVNGANAIALTELDNYAYTGVTSGDAATLLAAISNTANWTGDNSTAQTAPASFSVSGSAPVAGDQKAYLPFAGTTEDSSDASAALKIDNDYLLVGDDEANALRVYPINGGAAVAEWSFATDLAITDELDVEAGAKIGSTYYFIGSHSNESDGDEANDREHLFAVTLSGTGAATAFTFVGSYSGLESDLVNWDTNNTHGLGANYFGFATSVADGVAPESSSGFSIEGMTETTNGELLLGLRAPQADSNRRDKAIVITLTNPSSLLTGTVPTFNVAEIDLGGRGIRAMHTLAAGGYLLIAGPAGSPNATVANDFALFTWDGTTPPVQLDNDLDSLLAATGGSFESIVDIDASNLLQVLQDNGDTIWPGKTKKSKKLPAAEQQFVGNWLTLGSPVVDSAPPALQSQLPAHNATNIAVNTTVTLTFDEYVKAGTGSFVLLDGSSNVVETIPATDPNVSINGGEVTLTFAASLNENITYGITADNTALADTSGNAWGGLAAGAYQFTTLDSSSMPTYTLLITEVNSSATGEDFFELFNYGNTTIDLSGWKWDDNSADPNDSKAQTFPANTTLAAGERLIVVADTGATAFRAAWGLPASVTVMAESGDPGLGKGDAVVVFNSAGQVATALNYGSADVTTSGGRVITPAKKTDGTAATGEHAGIAFGGTLATASAIWDGQSTSDPRYMAAVAGQAGAVAQAGDAASVGSPGVLSGIGISADQTALNEGNSGNTNFNFTVTRSGAALGNASVDYAVSGAVDAADFGGTLPAGTVNFTDGQSSQTLTFHVSGDGDTESDERFTVTLTNPVNANIDTATADSTITNDDAQTYTLISAVQGNGNSSPIAGQTVCVEGIITANLPNMSGFYLQEEPGDHDADSATSEGLLIYGNRPSALTNADIGKTASACGTIKEWKGVTEMAYDGSSFTITNNAISLPAPVALTLPVADEAVFEQHEGMLVSIASAQSELVVTDLYPFGRYGNVMVTSDQVLRQFTEDNSPDVAGYAQHVLENRKDHIVVDDANSRQNPDDLIGRDGQPLNAARNPLRVGDTAQSVTGVIDQYIPSRPRDYLNYYRLQPTQTPVFSKPQGLLDIRPTAAELQAISAGSELRVASANVLNYFNTFANFTTPYGTSHDRRGANNAEELTRQTEKLVAQLIAMDAHIYGLMEMQNNGFDASSAIAALVNALNAEAGAGTFDYIKAPFTAGNGSAPAAGEDAITVGLIYKPASVTPVGKGAIPDTATYAAFTGSIGNRVPLAQTFKVGSEHQYITVVVNHFKSKGSLKLGADQNDGQGNNWQAREQAAAELVAWLATNPTQAPDGVDGNVLLMGDFNGYSKEKAITDIIAAGYDKITSGDSYTWDGMWGSLDHAFASAALKAQQDTELKWHVNAVEPGLFDYNTEYKPASKVRGDYYSDDMYRASDHDPFVLGFTLSENALQLNHIPATATMLTIGRAVDLADVTVSSPYTSGNVTVTFSATDGIIGGVSSPLVGSVSQVNQALANLTFTATGENPTLAIKAAMANAATVEKNYPLSAVKASAPNIENVPASAVQVTLNAVSQLADVMISGTGNETVSVTLLPSNGILGGLTDTDAAIDGIQLNGTAGEINAALQNATFTGTSTGMASIVISAATANSETATASYPLYVVKTGVLFSSSFE